MADPSALKSQILDSVAIHAANFTTINSRVNTLSATVTTLNTQITDLQAVISDTANLLAQEQKAHTENLREIIAAISNIPQLTVVPVEKVVPVIIK